MKNLIPSDFRYVMVTNWEGHWDQLKKWNYSTLFTTAFINHSLAAASWPEQADTLFIKINKDDLFEKSWIGKSKNFRKDNYKGRDAIRFDVSDLQPVDCPAKYKGFTIGWYASKPEEQISIEEKSYLLPPFISDMATCPWETFELYCAHLLRLLGLHDLHIISPTSNGGKPDGFFKFLSLAVIYDASLHPDFIDKKVQQIENYISQLKKERIHLDGYSYTITDLQKQVWIITRGKDIRTLRIEDHIKVKEIPYHHLVNLYLRRLEEQVTAMSLADLLKDI
jgi:hypothetical protein